MNQSSYKKRKNWIGKSYAHERFLLNINRTVSLLASGLGGIKSETDEFEGLFTQISDFKGIPGRKPKDYNLDFEIKSKEELIELSMDRRSAYYLRLIFEKGLKIQKQLRFHLFSILLVYIWGTFETYISQLFKELFEKRPEMLKSEKKKISYEEILERINDPLELLIECELKKFEHFKPKDLYKYFENKVNFIFKDSEIKDIEDLYLLRNVISHNTGVVKPYLRDKIPEEVQIENGEIRISKSYLKKMIKKLLKVEQRIESFVASKYFTD